MNDKKFLLGMTIIIAMFKDPVCGMMVDENKTAYFRSGRKEGLCMLRWLQESI
jgi:hypothetical protein